MEQWLLFCVQTRNTLSFSENFRNVRNAQLKPGYNIQIGVDSEYIVATDVFSDRNDVWTLIPFLKTMDEKLGFRYSSVTDDSGYESEEGYTYLRETGQTPYIKPQTYEK